VYCFVLPENRNISLEEIAKIFGDEDQVAVYSENLYVDDNTHQVVVGDRERATQVVDEVYAEYK
jgi:hypothetical protein